MTIVLGASGQLGWELHRILGNEAKFLNRTSVDLNQPAKVVEALRALKPSCVINAAAYTAVDQAESERDTAFRVNSESPGYIAELAQSEKFKFIHISTDYVFSGESQHPYREDEPPKPINVYGESKLEGEKRITEANPNALILRTSWVYSAHGKNFVKTVLRLAIEKPSIRVVEDQIGSLTWAADLARTLLRAGDLSGIYNFSNEGISSWYDVAQAVRVLKKLPLEILPIPSTQYPTPARRPKFSLLDKTKIKNELGIKIPHWMESLEKCLKELS
jgi:dTDP-4-dehydrorhamnose reductase